MDAGASALRVLKDSISDLKSTIQDAQQAGVTRATLSDLVELATLRTHSLFESFLQELFYLSLLHDSSVPGNGPTLHVTTRAEADLLILSPGSKREKFLSWLPLDRTFEMADAYLRAGSTFDRLRYRTVEKRAMLELVTVRNVVAHPSDHAHRQFVELAKSKSYPSTRAADYLLSQRSGATEVLLLMTQTEVIADGLLAPSSDAAALLLQPEAEFLAKQRSPVGLYECVRCGESAELTQLAVLGACPACEPLSACPACGHTPAAHSQWRRIRVG